MDVFDLMWDRNLVHCGSAITFMKNIPDGLVDLIVTDTPYGMNFNSRSKTMTTRKVKNDTWNDSLQNLLRAYFKECARILKDDGAIYSFCSHHHYEFFKRQISNKFEYQDTLIWVKNNHTLTNFATHYAPMRIPTKAATDSDGEAATDSDPKGPLFQRSDLVGVIFAVG